MRPPPKNFPYATIAALSMAVVVVLSLLVMGMGDNAGEWSSPAIAIVTVVLNIGLWTAFWFDYWKPAVKRLDAQKLGLTNLEADFDNLSGNVEGHQAVIGRMQTVLTTLPEIEKKLADLIAELAHHPPPSKPAARPQSVPPFSLPPATPPEPVSSHPAAMSAMAEAAIPADQPSDHPARDPADLIREKLGAMFVQEIKTAAGADAATVWDRYTARVTASSRQVTQHQVHWDRDGLSLCFHTHSSETYKDTGKCWLVQTGEQSLLFFPALAAATARKEDLPGCQIASNDIVLYAAKLARFVPPVVAQTQDGWAIRSDGAVEYR